MKRSQTLFFIISSYVILTLLYLFPVLRNFRGLAGHGDAWQFLWNFWWIKWAFAHDQGMWFTNMLHWPSGISLILQTMTLTSSLPAIFFSQFFSFVTSYNLLIIFHFILSGIGMYLLCHHISGNHFASFIGGFLFTFSPYRFAHYYGHLHLLTTWVLPFAILFLIRTLEAPTPAGVGVHRKWSWIGAVIFCVLTAYADLYYLLFLFITCGALVLWYFPRKREVLIRLGLIVAFTAILVLPYLGPLIHTVQSNPDFDVLGHDPVLNSNNAESFFIPGGRSMFRDITAKYWNSWSGWEETGSYVGYSVILLLILGIWKTRSKEFIFWTILGLLFAILSLGPYLHVGGRVLTSFSLPYAWLDRYVPLIHISGVPSRFFAITSLSLAILVSLTLSKQRKFIAMIFLVFLAFEYLPAPVEVSPVTVSPFYETLRNNPEQYAILDLSDAPAKVLFYQTIHEKPLIGGYTTRPTVSTDKFLAETDFKNKKTLQDLKVRYVLVPSGDLYAEGFYEIYSDEFLTAYRVY